MLLQGPHRLPVFLHGLGLVKWASPICYAWADEAVYQGRRFKSAFSRYNSGSWLSRGSLWYGDGMLFLNLTTYSPVDTMLRSILLILTAVTTFAFMHRSQSRLNWVLTVSSSFCHLRCLVYQQSYPSWRFSLLRINGRALWVCCVLAKSVCVSGILGDSRQRQFGNPSCLLSAMPHWQGFSAC